MEFEKFNKILHISKLHMSITQKLHGTNAQIAIEEIDAGEAGVDFHVKAGSRTRWLSVDDDNYGFCKWVKQNELELAVRLGVGRHYGEWVGKGINSGEGLEDKKFCLFNWRRWIGKELPENVTTVPLLYRGRISLDAINDAMERLKSQGSMLVPGYMKPEGIVIDIDGQLYKNVFDAEEVQWKETSKRIKSDKVDAPDINYLLQPLRLEKLLSRDEAYTRDYPKTLSRICKDYVQDLLDESQLKPGTEDERKAELKALGQSIYFFVKSIMGAR